VAIRSVKPNWYKKGMNCCSEFALPFNWRHPGGLYFCTNYPQDSNMCKFFSSRKDYPNVCRYFEYIRTGICDDICTCPDAISERKMEEI